MYKACLKGAVLMYGAIGSGSVFAQAQSASTPAREDAQAAASDQSSGQLQDIVVTAQKRAEKAQSTPLAISVATGNDLRERHITDLKSLTQAAPNVDLGNYVGVARLAIRGIGLEGGVPGSDPRVAYNLDGIYISRPTEVLGTFFDIDRIEVVRGPQGTLYGRNATAGAINVLTVTPGDELKGYIRGTVGNFGLFQSDGAVTLPVTQGFSIRLAEQTVDRSGYGRNIFNGTEIDNEHTQSARVKVRIQPTDAIKVVLSADYHHEADRNYGFHVFGPGGFTATGAPLPLASVRLGGTLAPDIRDSNGETVNINRRTFYGFGGELTWDLGAVTFTSLTGYRHSKIGLVFDLDTTQAVVADNRETENTDEFTQELRLNGRAGIFDWTIGGYYFHERVEGTVDFSPINANSVNPARPPSVSEGYLSGGILRTKAYAIFGQATVHVTDALSIDLGGRYSHEDRRDQEHPLYFNTATPYDPNFARPTAFLPEVSETEHAFTPKVSISYQINPDALIYATYAQGFKSGGYVLGTRQPAVRPEKLTDYEAGLKVDWFNHKLRTNIAAFYYDYKDLQVQKIQGTGFILLNAASARVKGVEAEMKLVASDSFRIDANATFLDATFRSFSTSDPARPALGVINLAGNRLTQSPRFTTTAGVEKDFDIGLGRVTLRGEVVHVSRIYFSSYNRPEASEEKNTKLNAFINFTDKNDFFTVSAFVRNITDKTTATTKTVSSALFGAPILGTLTPPRTFGVELGYKF